MTYLLLLTCQAKKIKVCDCGELQHLEKHDRPHYERGTNFVRFIGMIRKQNLNKNWSDLGSVLTNSIPETLQKDQKEWWGYQWNLIVGNEISRISSIDGMSQGVLYVRIKSGEWLPALESLKEKIVCELNSRAGQQRVKKIKIIT